MCLVIAVRRPNDVLLTGKHAGHEFAIVHNQSGYRCGYVKVEKDHPWYGTNYNDLDVDVHGGLTFAAADEPCDQGGPDDGWWVGFDCAHCGDAKDPALLTTDQLEYESNFENSFRQKYPEYANWKSPDTIKTTEYVEAECRKLCEQARHASGTIPG